jgi:hypothetical protein
MKERKKSRSEKKSCNEDGRLKCKVRRSKEMVQVFAERGEDGKSP